MKKNLLTIFSLACSLASICIDTPYGYTISSHQLEALGTMEIETFDHATLLDQDALNERHNGRTRTGRIAFMDQLDASNCGTWTMLENGDKVWMLRFRTANALAVNVLFDKLLMPQGSSLFLYSADLSFFDGPYTQEDCKTHGRFATAEVYGDEAIIEYYQPADVISEASIGLYGFGHLYNHVNDPRNEMDNDRSDPCEVDVNCPEGCDWKKERDSVVRLTLTDGGDQYLCSGSMVNNTGLDFKNYILTAFHCCEGISDADLLLCSVKYNWERSSCGSGLPLNHNKSGVVKHADSNDGGGSSGSDFALFELEGTIQNSWHVYYSGWDASNSTPDTGVCIHHPAGDYKKISFTDAMVSSSWGAANTHWRMAWYETESGWGVTEGGSSGSPVYNQDHRIVGTLTGGGSCCVVNDCGANTGPTAFDYYGKFKNHWSSNPNTAAQKLKVWLDPINEGATGTVTIDGMYVDDYLPVPCAVNIEDAPMSFDEVKIFPTITNGEMVISTSKFRSISEVRVFSSAGVLVEILTLPNASNKFDFSDYAAGLYYVSFIHVNGTHLTKKFSVVQ